MSTRTLTYLKGDHKFAFRYSPGRERELIDHIMHLADDAASTIDWVDAAMLSFRLTAEAAGSRSEDLQEQELV